MDFFSSLPRLDRLWCRSSFLNQWVPGGS